MRTESVLYLGLRRIVMRKYAVLAAAAGLALTGVAKADFIVTSTRTADTVDAGNDVVEFFAKNDGTNGTGTKVIASDITLADTSGGKLLIKFVSASTSAKADLSATKANVDANGNIIPDRSFVNILANDGNDDPTAYSVVSTVPDNTHANYAGGVTQFEVVGANLGGGINATTTNGGAGALVGVAVVPTGDPVKLSGTLGGELGAPVAVSAVNGVPEPASLGLLGLGALGLIRRRRA